MRLQYDDEYDYSRLYGVFVNNKGHYSIYVFDSKDKAYEFLNDCELYGVYNTEGYSVVDVVFDVDPNDISTYGKYCWDADKCCYVINKKAIKY